MYSRLCIFLLLSIVLINGAYYHEPNLWFFSTKFPINQSHAIDFRGCYQNQCVYVSPRKIYDSDDVLGFYNAKKSENLWAVANINSKFEKSVSLVFSENRPEEDDSTLWISPVPKSTVAPSEFDPRPFLKYVADPDPNVALFVSSISQARIENHVDHLANDFHTRNSLSPDAVEASIYLESLMTNLGCQQTHRENFRAGYAPNVFCEIPGTDTSASAVFVGAHYDCRSTGVNNPTQRAPGADDNASGSAGLLDILKVAADLIQSGISFRRKIMFGLFAGEEQGLVGSGVYARNLADSGVELLGMVGLDMIGYPQPNAPDTLYWMQVSTNQNLTSLAISLTQTYLGEGTIVTRTSACCSDQQSFHSNGYPAAAVAESLSYSNNPNYHRETDTPDTVTFSHVWRTTQAAAALVATLAEPTKNKII